MVNRPATSSIRRPRASTRRATSRTCRTTSSPRMPRRRRPRPPSAATQAGATPPQVISPADTPLLPAVPADAMPSDAAEEQAADDARRQIRLPLDPADPPMSLADKHLHLCSCNGTMPLDAAALARALELVRRAGGPDDAVPEGARRVRRRTPRATSSSPARRRRGCSATSPRRAARRRRSASSTSARPAAGRRRQARQRRRSPRCSPLAGAARARRRCRASLIAPRAAADRRSAEARCSGRRRCPGSSRVTVLVDDAHARRRGTELPARARFPGVFRHAHRHRRLARRVRRRVDAGQSDRPRPVHALQRVHATRVPRTRSTSRYQIDLDRCKRHRKCVAACGAVGAIDFDAQRARAARALRSRPRPAAARRAFAHAPAAAGLLRAGRRPAGAGQGGRRARDADAASSRSRSTSRYKASICAHSRSRQTGCNAVHRRAARRARSRPTAITSRSSRTFAWAAARARPCARRAR